MPKRLRYTQVLGLNARGLTRHEKRDIVWKKHVKGKYNRSQTIRTAPKKRSNVDYAYWDKYHDEYQRFEGMGLKQFLSNPCKILSIPQKKRKVTYQKLKNAQLRIERLKQRYSVAIPDKISLKLLSILTKGQGLLQLKTSNHGNGYWAHLLSKNEIKCKVFNVWQNGNLNVTKTKKKKKKKGKNFKKSLIEIAEESKEFVPILNKDLNGQIHEILSDFSQFVLLFIYPDFMIDDSVIHQINDNDEDESGETLNDGKQFRVFGGLMEAKEGKLLPSVECLQCFDGNWVVHIGELFGCTYSAENVWGRTTSKEFQIELQTNYHKVYEHEMRRWPLFRDTLTIWRRNKVINIGEEKIVCMQNDEMNDAMETRFGNVYGIKDCFGGKKSKKRNIFAGANFDGKYSADMTK